MRPQDIPPEIYERMSDDERNVMVWELYLTTCYIILANEDIIQRNIQIVIDMLRKRTLFYKQLKQKYL